MGGHVVRPIGVRLTLVTLMVGPNNLDGVCLRCHGEIGRLRETDSEVFFMENQGR